MPKWRIESSEVLSGEVAGEITAAKTVGHGIFDRDEDTNEFGSGCPFADGTTDHGFRQTDGSTFLQMGEQTIRVPDYVNSTSWTIHIALVTINSTAAGNGECKIITPWGDSNVVTIPNDLTVRVADMFKVFDADRSGTYIKLQAMIRRLSTGGQAGLSARFCFGNLWWKKA